MTFSASGRFTCNVCGTQCEAFTEPPSRETSSCPQCHSTVRLRSLVALISQEVLGVQLALPDFPELNGLRSFGMSDPPNLAVQLEKKFDYTNTFYHQAPNLDITAPHESEWGRYDFIVSSEVMEHVPVPVETAFANLFRLLKPNGLLLLTVPYGINMQPREHFPELHQYALASPGGKTVLVNRRRDGSTEIFENLCFHGGDGSTLEMRVFTEDKLKAILTAAGFSEVRIASEDIPEFGVLHTEQWSLPIVARKGRLTPSVTEIARSYRTVVKRAAELATELDSIRAEYQRHIEFHNTSHQELERVLAERLEWVRKTEALLEERTAWAQSLDKDCQAAQTHVAHLNTRISELEQALAQAQVQLANLRSQLWMRIKRKLGSG
ncbi:MAG: methyltransferase domain-containing protein [Acidobacteriota bacterium]